MIDMSYRMNPARDGAFLHARLWAKRIGKPVCVYVAPPGSNQSLTPDDWDAGMNVWYCRPEGEPPPEGVQLVETVN